MEHHFEHQAKIKFDADIFMNFLEKIAQQANETKRKEFFSSQTKESLNWMRQKQIYPIFDSQRFYKQQEIFGKLLNTAYQKFLEHYKVAHPSYTELYTNRQQIFNNLNIKFCAVYVQRNQLGNPISDEEYREEINKINHQADQQALAATQLSCPQGTNALDYLKVFHDNLPRKTKISYLERYASDIYDELINNLHSHFPNIFTACGFTTEAPRVGM